jgi:hypothetical protein
MTSAALDREAAQAAAKSYLNSHYPRHLAMTVLDAQPLSMDQGWVLWPQTAEYLRTHDPMDFVPAEPLLVTPGPLVAPLPTSLPVSESLAALGLVLRT